MPIINPWLFYFMGVVDYLKTLLGLAGLIYTAWLLIAIFNFSMEGLEGDKDFWKEVKQYIITPLVVVATLFIFVPSKDTLTKMVIAEHITVDNYEFAKGEVTELIDYIFDKINGDDDK